MCLPTTFHVAAYHNAFKLYDRVFRSTPAGLQQGTVRYILAGRYVLIDWH